ncbi:MAG: dihydrofolate reductase family protein [Solirubrobacterales bacterium]|nr:dihydrofolate reductase family protein [Solirubrobacterales bacterium]
MRRIIYSGNISLDGYIEDVNGDFGFTEPDEEVHRFWNQWIRDASASLMGRRLYETMEPYWTDVAAEPTGEETSDDFARAWVATPRFVVSRTLESVPEGLTLISDEVEDAVRGLKGESGGPIDMGGADLANSLAELDLIDELMMVVHPVVVGAGKANLGPAFAGTKWQLLEQSAFSSGAILLRYELARQ